MGPKHSSGGGKGGTGSGLMWRGGMGPGLRGREAARFAPPPATSTQARCSPLHRSGLPSPSLAGPLCSPPPRCVSLGPLSPPLPQPLPQRACSSPYCHHICPAGGDNRKGEGRAEASAGGLAPPPPGS